jgi:hypothetical protein
MALAVNEKYQCQIQRPLERLDLVQTFASKSYPRPAKYPPYATRIP